MKRVKLINYTYDNGIYIVCLGNGTKHQFKSKKQTLKFLFKSSSYLTDRLYSINLNLIILFTIYRNLWVYFWHSDNPEISNLFQTERNIKLNLQSVTESLDNCHLHACYPNGNYTAFSDLNFCVNSLIQVCKYLSKANKDKSYKSIEIQINNVLESLLLISSNLQSYSALQCDSIDFDKDNIPCFDLTHSIKAPGSKQSA